MSESYIVVERAPSVAEYTRVRAAAGLSAKSEAAALRGLAGGLYSVCVEHASEVVGIGRVIGDGGLFYDIVDIAVVPEHQRKGVGQKIMRALMKYLDEYAPPTALICLLSNRGEVPRFYEKFGFKTRDADMPAMIIRK
jgi:ribosomal protein S18 acetylase RimI-like enzyme